MISLSKKIFKRVAVAFSVLILISCSVQFPQLESVQRVMEERSTANELENASWVMDWNEESYTLYALETESGFVFAFDRRLEIQFQQGYVSKVIGFLPDGQVIDIESGAGFISYFINGELVAQHQCDDGALLYSDGLPFYRRSCEGDFAYSNEIYVDAQGDMIRLRFLLHPDYPTMTMTYSKANAQL